MSNNSEIQSDTITAEQIYELVLRIQAEDEKEACRILGRALRDSWMGGFERATTVASQSFEMLSKSLFTDSLNQFIKNRTNESNTGTCGKPESDSPKA